MSNLQPYINHLLEDIIQATRKHVPASTTCEQIKSLETLIQDWESWMVRTTPQPLGKICGLDPTLFPAPDKLTPSQQRQIMDRLLEMFESWNIRATIPKNVPYSKCYTLIVALLEKEARIPESSFYVFDFCTGNPEGCELEKYCPCLTFEERNRGWK